MKLFKTTLFAASLLMAGYAVAHTDEFLDSQKSPHDGQIRMTDMYHLELVVKDKELTVYVMNHANEAQPSAGMTATATVLSGEIKTEVKLEPAEENLLKGTGDFKTSEDMKVVLSVTPAPMTVRYTPLQKAEAPATATTAKDETKQ
ncbi:hypothetical protein [Thiothrix subterranea]|uniref:Uncharacterized protein n=1 Tax=Thiothrix subterranea TaxID=2735563 RepID=A0AA51QXL3_9GAMM|nr:hypothetical protein [Thiothrix subterranea]MDQ5769366.1 hypothetical protein [Thiothrix subterranea]WML85012.1 hypothetical protein RCG00_11915 [Thiothrix subterranea]